jgi:hypothetical protein
MSESERHQGENPEEPDSDADDFDEAVMAADDTGMVRNEAQIVEVEEEEGGALTPRDAP